MAIRQETAAEKTFSNSSDMIDCLKEKFGDSESPLYFFKEVKIEDLEILRAKSRLKVFNTVKGSSTFQVIVFKPNSYIIRASPRLYMCSACKEEFGSCSLFQEYTLVVQSLNKISTRSILYQEEIVKSCIVDDFIAKGCVVAVATEDKSPDTVWFIIINSVENCFKSEMVDDYGNTIPPKQNYISGRFLERSPISETLFVISKKLISYLLSK